MNQETLQKIHPRQVANKASKANLKKALEMTLAVESNAVRLNTQTFNFNRYKAVAEIGDYEALKDQARLIKEQAIENMPVLIEEVTKSVESRGGHVFFANDKDEANDYIKKVCLSHKAGLVIKAKSMTSEERKLKPVLEKAGIEVAETDLAEFILQISDEQPSHNVAPAIHRSRERISELFKSHFDTEYPLETGEDLTRFARDILRQKFLSADVGITGANMLEAEGGSLLLVESEGNIRMVTQAPPVHIAIAGIEKIVPTRKEFAVFIELLAASGTGQPLTSYTNILNPPLDLPPLAFNGRKKKEREFHLVLVDNGRMKMRSDPELKEALYCIRCSACLNSCANFQAVGGHAFGGETYSGGIGASWEIGTSGSLENGNFAELCTGCTRCVPNCPVRIDIPWLNTVIRDRLRRKKVIPSLQKQFFGNFAITGKYASIAPRLVNWISNLSLSRSILEMTTGADKRRQLPSFADVPFTKQYKIWREENLVNKANEFGSDVDTVLFADVYTNYNNPQCGMASVKVFDQIGIPISISGVLAEGRASQSQGLIGLAAKRASNVAKYLESFIDDGKDIIVTEPSVLALFRRDYKRLINNDPLFEKIKTHSYDPVEYINKLFTAYDINPKEVFNKDKFSEDKLFYHGHCQMKSIDAGFVAADLLKTLGFDVVISTSECCGMAGSFGYKKEYYELSKRVGDDLIDQINAADFTGKKRIVLASGTSCREQIGAETDQIILHPIEFLLKILIP